MPNAQKTSSRAGIEGHAASRAAGQDVRPSEQTAHVEWIGLSSTLKTVSLCHYLRIESLRREIHQGLQRIDTWNSANDFMRYGKGAEFANHKKSAEEPRVTLPRLKGGSSRESKADLYTGEFSLLDPEVHLEREASGLSPSAR